MTLSLNSFEEAARGASRTVGINIACTGFAAFSPSVAAGRLRLPNGLTLIIAPDHRAPIFAYQTWFRVGSRNEDPERTGLAHLFEHLMFKGTRKFASGTFDKEMERRGAQTNAATWVDWTYYTEALAARDDNLATVVDFESDRMTQLLLDEATFKSELEVVKNERRMSVEDSVGGILSEQLMALAFEKHPYRWPTIGSMAHLEAASIADLQQFYKRHYCPSNATVVLAGDVELEPTLALLARGYGGLASGQATSPPRPAEPVQKVPREVTFERPIMAPQMVIGYRAACQSDPHFAALEMLAEILVSGDTGRLYQRLVVQEQIATDISGHVYPFAEPGLFEFHMALRPDADPKVAQEMLQAELDACAADVCAEELDKARNSLELGVLESLKDVEGRAEALGHFETNERDFGLAFRQTETFARQDLATLQKACRATFQRSSRNTVIALPNHTPGGAA